jgi:hypothetical protein
MIDIMIDMVIKKFGFEAKETIDFCTLCVAFCDGLIDFDKVMETFICLDS